MKAYLEGMYANRRLQQTGGPAKSDSDHDILDAQKLICNVWWNDKEYMSFHRSWLEQKSNKIDLSMNYLPELASSWGYGYIDHLCSK